MEFYEKLKEAGYVGRESGQEESEYGDGGLFYRLFSAPKPKPCYTIDKHGTLRENFTFKGCHDTERIINTDE